MFDRSKRSEKGQHNLPSPLQGAAKLEERNLSERKHRHQYTLWGHVGELAPKLLCTQRGCQLTLTHLYSVMIMQCHAGADYVKVSEGKA